MNFIIAAILSLPLLVVATPITLDTRGGSGGGGTCPGSLEGCAAFLPVGSTLTSGRIHWDVPLTNVHPYADAHLAQHEPRTLEWDFPRLWLLPPQCQ